MLKLARLVLRLAILYLALGLCLFFGITQGFGVAPVEIAQAVIIISIEPQGFIIFHRRESRVLSTALVSYTDHPIHL